MLRYFPTEATGSIDLTSIVAPEAQRSDRLRAQSSRVPLSVYISLIVGGGSLAIIGVVGVVYFRFARRKGLFIHDKESNIEMVWVEEKEDQLPQ